MFEFINSFYTFMFPTLVSKAVFVLAVFVICGQRIYLYVTKSDPASNS